MVPALHLTTVPVTGGGKGHFVMKVRIHHAPNTQLINDYYPLAICNPSCLNGGQCDRPNHCKCTAEYTGTQCEDGMTADAYVIYQMNIIMTLWHSIFGI